MELSPLLKLSPSRSPLDSQPNRSWNMTSWFSDLFGSSKSKPSTNLLYACVAYNNRIVAEDDPACNFLARRYLQEITRTGPGVVDIKEEDVKRSGRAIGYFNALSDYDTPGEGQLTFFVIAPLESQEKRAVMYLHVIKTMFLEDLSLDNKPPGTDFGNQDPEVYKTFNNKLRKLMILPEAKSSVELNELPSTAQHDEAGKTIHSLQGAIGDTMVILRNNIEATAERGSKINDLQESVAMLEEESQNFKFSARKIREKYRNKEWKWRIYVGVGVIIFLVIVIVPAVVTTR